MNRAKETALSSAGMGMPQLADQDAGQEDARGRAQREGADLPLAQEEAQGQRGEQGDLRMASQQFGNNGHWLFLARKGDPGEPQGSRHPPEEHGISAPRAWPARRSSTRRTARRMPHRPRQPPARIVPGSCGTR